jgi:hypothetical protein
MNSKVNMMESSRGGTTLWLGGAWAPPSQRVFPKKKKSGKNKNKNKLNFTPYFFYFLSFGPPKVFFLNLAPPMFETWLRPWSQGLNPGPLALISC